MPAPEEFPVEQQDKHFLLFEEWDTMDTQQARVALKSNRPAWLENLQPVGTNDLLTVPGPAPAIATLAGETIARQFYATYGGQDYIIAFCLSGSAYQINLSGGVVTKFANAGTFSGTSDATQWKSERILIADPSSGYCTWDGTAFVKQGGVSPNIVVTNGGSGYVVAPTVTISGGTGGGATAVATIVGGVVVSVQLTNAGAGYLASDTLTVTFSSGAAAATAIVWPFLSFTPVSLAVYQGRVWLVGARSLQWTGTKGYDDVSVAGAAGTQIFPDADLVHSFTAIRNLNNYLYLFGDFSVRQIGTITVSGTPPVTTFTPTTLTSDQGTIFPQSIVSYNRLVLFANTVGVWAIYGASVEKISGPMDGVFRNIDFTQSLVCVTNDLQNQRTLLVLAKYNDPLLGVRAIFMAFVDRKWFIVAQGTSIRAAAQAPVGGVMQTYVSSGADITRILANPNTPVSWLLRTALSPDKRPFMGKRSIRIGVAHAAQTVTNVTLTSDSENQVLSQNYTIAFPIVWLNALGQIVTWLNALSQIVTFVGAGFLFKAVQANASGIYLGASISGNAANFHVHGLIIEYKDAAAMRSRNT